MSERQCRRCGCTEDRACTTGDGTCRWVESDLCSSCADLTNTITAAIIMARQIFEDAAATGAIAGQFACHVCGKPFHWRASGHRNGHVRGACETEKCVRFIQ